ncbi:hypothetical protein ABW19_dt0204310 [Dactylella cylindrospora]|nr:hypothetical protein ABW19_dt0204310 [Dactylella cylindrospora]
MFYDNGVWMEESPKRCIPPHLLRHTPEFEVAVAAEVSNYFAKDSLRVSYGQAAMVEDAAPVWPQVGNDVAESDENLGDKLLESIDINIDQFLDWRLNSLEVAGNPFLDFARLDPSTTPHHDDSWVVNQLSHDYEQQKPEGDHDHEIFDFEEMGPDADPMDITSKQLDRPKIREYSLNDLDMKALSWKRIPRKEEILYKPGVEEQKRPLLHESEIEQLPLQELWVEQLRQEELKRLEGELRAEQTQKSPERLGEQIMDWLREFGHRNNK